MNETLIKETATALISTGLSAMGWDTLQIDEGWEACAQYGANGRRCKTPAPRDAQGRIVANQTKFPGGIKPLADWLHARGLKIGIYTSASPRACGGNWGSLGHEKTDAEAFAEWGVDWVKVDNCAYGSWSDLIANQRVMSAAIQATHRPMIIQMGAGDHMPLLYNPNASIDNSFARGFADQSWVWGPPIAHTWYTGHDKHNSWASTVSNVLHNYRGAQVYGTPTPPLTLTLTLYMRTVLPETRGLELPGRSVVRDHGVPGGHAHVSGGGTVHVRPVRGHGRPAHARVRHPTPLAADASLPAQPRATGGQPGPVGHPGLGSEPRQRSAGR